MTSWRVLTPAIAAACCAQHCTPHPVDAVVLVSGDAAGGDAGSNGDAIPTIDSGSVDDANSTGPAAWPDPDAGHTANSDPWISQNHDRITVMQPQVLVLDFANEFNDQDGGLVAAGYDLQTTVQQLVKEHVEAFEVASQYQGYNNSSAPAFLQYQVKPSHIIDLRDNNGQVNSSKLPIANGSNGSVVDYSQLNSAAFAKRINILDETGKPLILCQLFEQGLINEVWGMVADPLPANPPSPASVKFASFVESKQVYDSDNKPVPGSQVCTSTPDAPCQLTCSVSIRFFDFNPGRGAGCHLFASGLQWPQYVQPSSIVLPALQKVAQTFFNFDFAERFGRSASFNSFFDVCSPNTDGGTCIDWTTPDGGPFTGAVSGPFASQPFDLNPLTAGCGNVVFPPNATAYSVQAGDLPVLSSCEDYGMHDGPGGADQTTPYTNQRIDRLRPPNLVTDCGGAQPAYLLESMPGLGTTATAADGTPMKNWWVYLFY